jgi:hypothetical protein
MPGCPRGAGTKDFSASRAFQGVFFFESLPLLPCASEAPSAAGCALSVALVHGEKIWEHPSRGSFLRGIALFCYSAIELFAGRLSIDMTSFLKRMYSGLAALFLAMAFFFAGTRAHAQEAAVAPPSVESKAASDADFIAAADEVLGMMSEITGLKLRTPLKKSLRSRKEIRAYVIKQMNEEKNPAERYVGARSAEAFGLLPKGFDLEAFMINVLTEQVEGLYDPKTREFYIADWSPLSDQRMVMAHELTHALEDQHFQIEAWVKAARPNEDAELARDAVLEGSAMAAMVDYLMLGTGKSLKDLPEFDASMLMGDLGSTPTLQKAPPFIKDALIFPYLSGLTFSAAILKNGGWSALPVLFEKPPVSTQQILHPGLYRSGKTTKNVTLPRLKKLLGGNWSKLEENVMGEFGWKEVLKQFLDGERAKTLAAAWDGDSYALYEEKRSKRLVLVARLRLDSEEHAERFFGQYSEALENKYSERSNLFRRPNFFSFDTPDGGVFLDCFGAECVTLEGTTRKMFDGLTKAIEWPMAPQPPQRPKPAPAKTAMIFAPAGMRPRGMFNKRELDLASFIHFGNERAGKVSPDHREFSFAAEDVRRAAETFPPGARTARQDTDRAWRCADA